MNSSDEQLAEILLIVEIKQIPNFELIVGASYTMIQRANLKRYFHLFISYIVYSLKRQKLAIEKMYEKKESSIISSIRKRSLEKNVEVPVEEMRIRNELLKYSHLNDGQRRALQAMFKRGTHEIIADLVRGVHRSGTAWHW